MAELWFGFGFEGSVINGLMDPDPYYLSRLKNLKKVQNFRIFNEFIQV
jgi:hypothetical protein